MFVGEIQLPLISWSHPIQHQFLRATLFGLSVFIFSGCGYINGGLFTKGTSLTLADANSKSQQYTNHQLITVAIKSESKTSSYCLSENQKTAPASSASDCGAHASSVDGWTHSAPSSITLSNGDGLKKLFLWTVASNGAISGTATTGTIYLDTSAPTIAFSNTPGSLSSGSVSFDFSGVDAGSGVAGYTCQVDSSYVSSCVSPVTLSGLSNGLHSFTVKATDRAGNVSAPTSYSWTVTMPAAQIVAVTQPSSSTVSQVAFAQAPKFELRDSTGAVVTVGPDAIALVTLTITSGTGALLGTTSVNAIAGVADFATAGLNVDLAGTGKVLTATKADTRSGGLGSAPMSITTSAFTITPGPASLANSVVTVASTQLNSLASAVATLTAKDAAGNSLTTGGLSPGFASSGAGTSELSFGLPTDNGNGTYSVSYTGGKGGTAVSIQGSIGGSVLTSTLPSVKVVPVISAPNLNGAASQSMKFIVTLNKESNSDVTFHYATANGTALAGTDYTAGSGDVTIAAGSLTGNFSIATSGNATLSISKSYTAALTSITNASVSSLSPQGTIYTPTFSEDFTTSTLPSSFTFSRASVGTYFDSSGVLQTAAVDTPRLYYQPGNHAVVGTLAEDASTNQALYSEQFNDGNWLKTGGAIAGADINTTAVTAPDGSHNAEFFREDSSTGLHQIVLAPTYTIPAGNFASASVFVKAGGRNQVRVGFSNGSNYIFGSFDLSGSGAQRGFGGSIPGYGGDARLLIQWMDPLPNGWFRIMVSGIISASSPQAVNIFVSMSDDAAATDSYTGDGSSGQYIWGAQLELATRPTSYIATTSSPVTRAGEVLNHMLGSEYQASHGTWLVSQSYVGVVGGGIYSGIFNITGTGGNYMSVFGFAQDTYQLLGYNSGVNNVDQFGSLGFSSGFYGFYGINKFALSYDSSTGTQAYNNGGTAGPLGVGTIPTLNRFNLATPGGGGGANIIRSVKYYPVALPTDCLNAMTAP